MSCAKWTGSLKKTPRIPPQPVTSWRPQELSTFLRHKQWHHYKKPQPVAARTQSLQLNPLGSSAWSENSPILVNFIIFRGHCVGPLPSPSPNDLHSDYVRLGETNQRATSININELKWIMLVTGDDSLTGAINTGAVRKLISFCLHSYGRTRHCDRRTHETRRLLWAHHVTHADRINSISRTSGGGRGGGAVRFRHVSTAAHVRRALLQLSTNPAAASGASEVKYDSNDGRWRKKVRNEKRINWLSVNKQNIPMFWACHSDGAISFTQQEALSRRRVETPTEKKKDENI